jgi:putative spermidine/putrescine transport system substrate-binding protein
MTVTGARGAYAQGTPRFITVTAYGGVFETALRETFVEDFAKKTGVEARVQLGNPNQWIGQVEASPAKPPLDVIIGATDVVIDAGKKGLLDKPTVEKIPNMADVPKFFVDLCEGWGVCFDYGTIGLAYHKGRVKNPPKSIAEFVERTAKGEWTASIPTVAYGPTTYWVIWNFNDVFGGKNDNIDPAIAAIKRMRPKTVFWSSITDFLNHLESGEADIGLYPDGRVWTAFDSGATWIEFINPSEGGVMTPIGVVKPKNAPNIAWKFIDSMLAPEPQARFAELLNFGVTNEKVKYSDKVKTRITPWKETRLAPPEIAKFVPQWVERWNKELGV